jgi:hypothetical protein
MQRKTYCVYNQTNECFLSLGATQGNSPFARLKEWFGIGSRRIDEGIWIRPFDRHPISFFATRDLVYLDVMHRVLQVIESHPMLRVVPVRLDATSVLALPVHTISSSQTKEGNQLMICVAAEMERRLRKLFQGHASQGQAQPTEPQQSRAPLSHRPGQAQLGEPQTERPHQEPPAFCAAMDIGTAVSGSDRHAPQQVGSGIYFAEGGKLAVHAIRDLSADGLYLVTRDRWPIGAEVKMSLQPSGGPNDKNTGPIIVQMRVTRWGADGVGLEFAGAATEASELKSLYVC